MLWSPVCSDKLRRHTKSKCISVLSRRTLSVAVAYESRLQLNLLPKLEEPTQDSIRHHYLIVPNCKASVCFKGSRSSNSVSNLLSSASLRDGGLTHVPGPWQSDCRCNSRQGLSFFLKPSLKGRVSKCALWFHSVTWCVCFVLFSSHPTASISEAKHLWFLCFYCGKVDDVV